MNKRKVLLIAQDRIENLKTFTPHNISEKQIAEETLDWLKFIEKLLKKEIQKNG